MKIFFLLFRELIFIHTKNLDIKEKHFKLIFCSQKIWKHKNCKNVQILKRKIS